MTEATSRSPSVLKGAGIDFSPLSLEHGSQEPNGLRSNSVSLLKGLISYESRSE